MDNKQVIVVDDDAGMIDTITMILETAGYLVTAYSSPQVIINREFTIPDIFIIDKQLAGVDGLDICKFLKNDMSTKDIPVIIISASPNIKNAALQAGADATLEKPFKMNELRELVKAYIR